MNTILIDSHILLWILFRPELLTQKSRAALEASTEVYVSIVSIWELAIKHKKGKLLYSPEEIIPGIDRSGLKLLSCQPKHVAAYGKIVAPNSDPFDTMLLAQSETEGMAFMTADKDIIGSNYLIMDATK